MRSTQRLIGRYLPSAPGTGRPVLAEPGRLQTDAVDRAGSGRVRSLGAGWGRVVMATASAGWLSIGPTSALPGQPPTAIDDCPTRLGRGRVGGPRAWLMHLPAALAG